MKGSAETRRRCNSVAWEYVMETRVNIYDLDTPTLLVDLDRLERNIARMAQLAHTGGKALRPHTKTHKTPEVARMQVAAGARGLTVAKLGEAEVLADAGFDDLFIANELVGSLKVERLLALLERAQIRVAVDSKEVVQPISAAAKARGLRVPVMIEVDTGLGRAGVRSLPEAVELAQYIMDQPGVEFLGIFTHEGQLYRGQTRVDPVAARAVADTMRNIATELKNRGIPCQVVSVGSTPGAPLLAQEEGLDELRPGVYVYYDRSQMSRGIDRDQCALTVLATVVSVRADGKIIIDSGTKSLASDSPFEDKTYGEIVGKPDIRFAAISEEHGHLVQHTDSGLRVGDKVRVIPNHACTCVNMHDTVTLYRGEWVETTLPITGRGKIR